jgi:hypothetical protein
MSGFTEEGLTRLERAIQKGTLTVKYEDRQITYRSLAEMLQTRDLMRDELGLKSNRVRRTVVATRKGLR